MLRLETIIILSVIFLINIINGAGSRLAKDRIHKLQSNELSAKRSQTQQYPNLLGEWSNWSSCNRKCTRRRVRYCLEPQFCDKKVIKQTKRCMRRGKRCSFTPRKIRKDKAKQMEKTVYELLYGEWSQWSPCTRSCKKRRYRSCVNKNVCKGTVLMEHRVCYASNTKCKILYEKSKEKNKNEVEKKKKNESDSNNSKKALPDKKNSNISGNNSSNRLHVKGCGIRNITATTRIIGGQESRQGSWPWQVAILTQWKEQYCGGVMITPDWVLTAAHCLRRRMRRVILRIGEHNFHVKEGHEQDFKINKQAAKLHPKFSMKDIDSDIALVQLKEPIKNEDSIGYACVPEKDDVLPEKTLCYVVGWGKEKETHLFGTDVLREVAVPLVNKAKCQDAFDFKITQNQMCAGYRKGGRDTCAGDSGGPLMCEITKQGVKRWYVYGVTSFGEGCGDKGKYGIYTDVKNFHQWIKKTVSYS